MHEKVLLVPRPQSVQWLPGARKVQKPLGVALTAGLKALGETLEESFSGDFCPGEAVHFEQAAGLSQEGYRLTVTETAIAVAYAAPAGAFYALMTLRQLMVGDTMPCCDIEDAPALGMRGYMLDVGRGKIPTLHTLYQTADMLAAFKYNHLQLYMEGPAFAYPSFPDAWRDKTPLTPQEMRAFAAYCRRRFITLTPCQNSLGHMGPWLVDPALRPLAEKEEGMVVHGIPVPPTTLDCQNPASLAFVKTLADDLLPCFFSPYYNAGLDEPFELGKGKNKALAEQVGAQTLYLDYVKKLHAYVREKGLTMMMWADVVIRDPSTVEKLPKDILLLEWGYEAGYPFEKRASLLQGLGCRFCLCCCTSTSNTITGHTDNMLANVRQAASAAHAFHAQGLLLTDWGDGGHMHYWPISWPAILLAGALAWNGTGLTDQELIDALDTLVFCDDAKQLGAAVLDLGRYDRWEELPLGCRTLASLPLEWGPLRGEESWSRLLQGLTAINVQLMPPEVSGPLARAAQNPKVLDLNAIESWHRDLRSRIALSRPHCLDAELVKQELTNGLDMVWTLSRARAALRENTLCPSLADDIEAVAQTHRQLWLMRNKHSEVEQGIRRLLAVAEALKGSGT